MAGEGVTGGNPVRALIAINDFLSLYGSRLQAEEVARLRRLSKMVVDGQMRPEDAGSILSAARARIE